LEMLKKFQDSPNKRERVSSASEVQLWGECVVCVRCMAQEAFLLRPDILQDLTSCYTKWRTLTSFGM
jgi:hypothetical protein